MDIKYSKQAVKAINAMDRPTKSRIKIGIEGLNKIPPEGDIKALKGSDGSYRLRIGSWRILYSYMENDIILIEKIAPRGQVYKGV